MTIVEKIAEYAKERVVKAKEKESLESVKEKAYAMPKKCFPFEMALRGKNIAFICECKKASPSKGVISEEFPYIMIAKEYEEAGADCISVLTEPKWFLGKIEYLKEISDEVSIPCLRKDFIVDEYMIYESKIFGADAVLLICSILTQRQLNRYIHICDDLEMSALVEVHDEEEIKMALRAGARIIGVNNRNLKDFSVDTKNSIRLKKLVPDDVLFVAESGIRNHEDVKALKEADVDAVLVGETLMKASEKKQKLRELRGAV